MTFNFIYATGRVEKIHVEAGSDFVFIESVVSALKYKSDNMTGNAVNVYVDGSSDTVFIESVVSMLKYEFNNERAQKRRYGGSLDDAQYNDYPAPNDTQEEAFRNIDAEALRAAVEKLKPDERFIINRLYLDPVIVTQTELAVEMGINVDVLKKRLRRIKKKLLRRLT